jgi:hypothetical protein
MNCKGGTGAYIENKFVIKLGHRIVISFFKLYLLKSVNH